MNTMDVMLTVIRLLIGLLFFGHGGRKLFGWFGGTGWKGTTEAVRELGFRPAKFWTLISGLADFLGGLSLILGLLTPIGAALILGERITAILSLHARKGLWDVQGGAEYPLVVAANALWFGLLGGGAFSLDAALKFTWQPEMLFVVSGVIILAGIVIALLTTVGMSSQKHLHAH